MKASQRIILLLLVGFILTQCKTYQPISDTNALGSAEIISSQRIEALLNQVDPNNKILILRHEEKKYELEYLSHTGDTLSALHHQRIPNSSKVNTTQVKMPLNQIEEVKVKKTNYLLSIGIPTGIVLILYLARHEIVDISPGFTF